MQRSIDVECDAYTELASKVFDIKFTGRSVFAVPDLPTLPPNFKLGLIVGPSGSGKSLLLGEIGEEITPVWQRNKATISNFRSPSDAIELLSGVGFNSIPSWLRPYHVLSTGERFRADLARRLEYDGVVVVDEFTSTVDRNVAKATSMSLRRFVDSYVTPALVLASCHYDIIEWLQPDWVFDTLSMEMRPRGSLQPRPAIELEIIPCRREIWRIFAPHHYLRADLANSSRCFMALWSDVLVGFSSSISMPCGTVKKAWREHRTVVLPDFQGMGIGPRLSDAVAELHVREGKRYYSRTAHPRLGGYRDNSPKWKQTSKHKAVRKDVQRRQGTTCWNDYYGDGLRVCFSHEYVGA